MEGATETGPGPKAAARDALNANLACARQDLDGVLARLGDADLLWSPREGMPTIAIQTGVWPDEGPDAFAVQSATLEEIKAAMAALRVETYRYIDSLHDTELEQPIPNPNRWREALRMTDCPLSEVLRNIAAHEWYHTGQLITYLWLRGDNPDDW
jgi:uncharacterized damage-inducible protein DinB